MPDKMKELEELEKKATKGPWNYHNPKPGDKDLCFEGPDGLVLYFDDVEPERQIADANLIVALRNNAPALIEGWKIMKEVLENWKSCVDLAHGFGGKTIVWEDVIKFNNDSLTRITELEKGMEV